MVKYTSAECFAGIGAWGKALKRVTKRHGDTHELKYYFENDKYASNAFSAIHNVSEELNKWDITQDVEVEQVDIFFYSPPCQTFSIAGKKEGRTVAKGNLFDSALKYLKCSSPKFAIMENVANLAYQFKDDFIDMLKDLDDAGYVNYNKVLNSKDYGIPQNRERIFVVSIRKDLYEQGWRFEWPKPIKLKLRLKDVLEQEVDKKYFLSETMVRGLIVHNDKHNEKGTGFIFEPRDTDGIALCLRANSAFCPTDNAVKVNKTGFINQDTQASQVFGESGISPTICSGSHGYANGYVNVKSATKAGYEVAVEGDSINLDQLDSETRRGRVGKQVAQTLTTSCNQEVLCQTGYIGSNVQGMRVYDVNGISVTLSSQGGGGGAKTGLHTVNKVLNQNNKTDIRKLTPLECFRLQGFDDEDYYKAVSSYDSKWQEGKSDSQMYIRAGNSITVNVIEEILENLLYQRKQDVQMTLF